ncbi:MAG: enoyl-CoA hydratase/isomerase family protein [Rhodothalassiaceae bacterium]
MSEHLRLETSGPVARLIYDRPSVKNAFRYDMWAAVPALLQQAAADPAVRVILLCSAQQGIFSAGADLVEFERFTADLEARGANHQAIGEAARAVAACPKPVLAAIDGACMGGGFILAGAADFRLASDRSRFGFPPAKLGLLYHTQALIHLIGLIGPGQAKRLLFTAAVLDAHEARAIGLVEQVVAADGFQAATDAAVATIAALSASAIAAMKDQVAGVMQGELSETPHRAAQFLAAHDSPDHAEGLAAFREKRAPKFGTARG